MPDELLPFSVGVELEFNRASDPNNVLSRATYRGIPMSPTAFPGWVLKTDASCGYEAVSPILRTEEDLDQIAQVAAALRDLHAHVDGRCGYHVHIGMPELIANGQHEATKRLFAFLCRYERAFFALAGDNRSSSRYCRPIPTHIFEALRAGKGVEAWQVTGRNQDEHDNRYTWCNGQAYPKYGTLEFRIMGGTLHTKVILGWISFLLHVLDNCLYGSCKAQFRKEKTACNSVEFLIHDMLQRCGSYGRGIVRDRKRAITARKWVFTRYKALYGKSFRNAVNQKQYEKERLEKLAENYECT